MAADRGCVRVDGVTWSGSAAPEEQTKPTIEDDEEATVTGGSSAFYSIGVGMPEK